jgi:two-component system chemotaxis sensor kinase CheA
VEKVINYTNSKYKFGNDIEYLVKQAQEKSAEYWDICGEMENLAVTFDMEEVYFGRRLSGDRIQFILSSKFVTEASKPLEVFFSGDQIPEIETAYRSQKLSFSENTALEKEIWGNIVSGVLPVLDKDNQVTGFFGVDYDIRKTNKLKHHSLLIMLAALVFAAGAGIILSFNINRTFIKPLREMRDLADEMSELRFNKRITIFRNDELGDMQHALMLTRHNLKHALDDLKNERDEITAMKDNLKLGVFMMDRCFVIQPHYSLALEDMLGANNFTGVCFTRFIEGAFSEKTNKTIIDYFEMMLSQNFPVDVLESINPLNEFAFTTRKGEEKTLRCSFTTIDHITQNRNDPGNDANDAVSKVYILAKIEDISTEAKLKKHIEKTQAEKQKEMRNLFEVFKVDPRMGFEVLQDTGNNLNAIKQLIQDVYDDKIEGRKALTAIFQKAHASKSDLVILGMGTIGDHFHEFEGMIKKAIEATSLAKNSFKVLDEESTSLLKEKDNLRDTIKMLVAYRNRQPGDEAKPSAFLHTALNRAAERVAADTGKKIKFTAEALEINDFSSNLRRELKYILTQLVRNSAVHGIEMPNERSEAGKNETGTITLSIRAGSVVNISLKDDGKGLAWGKIKNKAVQLGFISENEDMSEDALCDILFKEGFSTAEETTLHAGRGVGLNLVKDKVSELNGTIRIESESGKGTEFIIVIPLQQ